MHARSTLALFALRASRRARGGAFSFFPLPPPRLLRRRGPQHRQRGRKRQLFQQQQGHQRRRLLLRGPRLTGPLRGGDVDRLRRRGVGLPRREGGRVFPWELCGEGRRGAASWRLFVLPRRRLLRRRRRGCCRCFCCRCGGSCRSSRDRGVIFSVGARRGAEERGALWERREQGFFVFVCCRSCSCCRPAPLRPCSSTAPRRALWWALDPCRALALSLKTPLLEPPSFSPCPHPPPTRTLSSVMFSQKKKANPRIPVSSPTKRL